MPLVMKIPRISIALQQAVMRCMRENLQRACLTLAQDYPEPSVAYQQRGTVAASAWLQQNQIRLNPVLLLENQQAFLQQVIPHELAHLLVWQHFGNAAPHGKEWRWMMEHILRVPALRTHDFVLDSLLRPLFHYRCVCRDHQLTLRRHNKVLRNREYRCIHCGIILQFIAKITTKNATEALAEHPAGVENSASCAVRVAIT